MPHARRQPPQRLQDALGGLAGNQPPVQVDPAGVRHGVDRLGIALHPAHHDGGLAQERILGQALRHSLHAGDEGQRLVDRVLAEVRHAGVTGAAGGRGHDLGPAAVPPGDPQVAGLAGQHIVRPDPALLQKAPQRQPLAVLLLDRAQHVQGERRRPDPGCLISAAAVHQGGQPALVVRGADAEERRRLRPRRRRAGAATFPARPAPRCRDGRRTG